MRRYSIFIFISILFGTVLFFAGCIDEPTIDQPVRPFAYMRLGNYASNLAAMRITMFERQTISGRDTLIFYKQFPSVAYDSIIAYQEINAGKYKVMAVDLASKDTVFLKDVEFPSYQITSFLFMGEYSRNDLLNTFNTYTLEEGLTKVSHAPNAGKFNIHFVYVVSEGITPPAKTPTLDVYVTTPTKTDSLIGIDLLPKDVKGFANMKPDTLQFRTKADNTSNIVAAGTRSYFRAGVNYFAFISGTANTPKMTIRAFDPLPVREK